jgi:hypothetical protein
MIKRDFDLPYGIRAYSRVKGETILIISVALLLSSSFAAVPLANAQATEDKAEDWFIYPSQQAIFGQAANATQQNDTAMLNITAISAEEWRQFAEQGIKSLTSSADSPEMASVTDYNIPGPNGNEIHLRVYDPGVREGLLQFLYMRLVEVG